MNQTTIKGEYTFNGKGLHTGVPVSITIKPAPADTGIAFIRTDISEDAVIKAIAENVSKTDRSTTLSQDGRSVSTVEHILSALTGLGVDNAFIDIDNIEVPILDGSARPYAEAISRDGFAVLDGQKEAFTLKETVEVKDPDSGAYVRIEPAASPEYEVTVDFGSKVLGIQKAAWTPDMDYLSEVASCRTFCFFHELEFLFKNNLIKGGDVDNAIVVVEYPVQDAQLESLLTLFNRPKLEITDKGYLNNVELRFPNECGRHKLLDLIGDIRLAGSGLNVKVTAYKPGHALNTAAAKALATALNQK